MAEATHRLPLLLLALVAGLAGDEADVLGHALLDGFLGVLGDLQRKERERYGRRGTGHVQGEARCHLCVSRKHSLHDASNVGHRQVAVLLSGVGVDDRDMLVILRDVAEVVRLGVRVQGIARLGGFICCVVIVIVVVVVIVIVVLVLLVVFILYFLLLPFGTFSSRLILQHKFARL